VTDLTLRYLVNVPSGRAETEPMPMVIVMHGRGADAHDLADLAPMLDAAPGCRFVFPNALRPWETAPGMTFGWTWFDGWPPEPSSLVASRENLLKFIDEIRERYATTALIVAGFSQGAMMALDVGLRTDAAALIVMSGGLYEFPEGGVVRASGAPSKAREDARTTPARTTPPVFIGHGTIDDVVPISYGRRARLVLEERGFDVEYHEYPMGHQIVMEEIEDVRRFLGVSLATERP